MKKTLVILLLLCSTVAVGQSKSVYIKSQAFTFKTVFETTEYTDEPIKKVGVFANNRKLLMHTISKIGGDHNSEDVELGTYETTDSTIIFYSYWARAGDAPVSPFGVRKQIYQVTKNGTLILKKAELYIETSRKGWEENKGIEYLFMKPKNEVERKQLMEYIKGTEKEYNASFVFGSKADLLFRNVKAKLKTQINTATKDWKMIYSKNGFGYKI